MFDLIGWAVRTIFINEEVCIHDEDCLFTVQKLRTASFTSMKSQSCLITSQV